MYNVKPGDRAEIINSINGLTGPSVGRIVMVFANAPDKGDFDATYSDNANALNDPHHYCPPSPYEKEHTVLGKIWPVQCIQGQPIVSEYGAAGDWIDVPDQFLRRLLPDAPDQAIERETALLRDN